MLYYKIQSFDGELLLYFGAGPTVSDLTLR